MSRPGRFLTSIAQAISTMGLYQEGHPARERALTSAHDRLQELQETQPTCQFTFLDDHIILDRRPLRDLSSWDWGSRLARAGIQWLELTGPVAREDLEVFLEAAHRRMSGVASTTAEVRTGRPTAIRWGAAVVREQEHLPGGGGGRLITATLGFNLADEVGAVDWLHGELKEGRKLQMIEAECIIRSLSVAMHGDQAFMIPLLRMKRFDQYTTAHAMNVSILAMSLAEFIGLSPREVRTFGIAGLLHDLGKVIVPEEILNKPGKLTEQERAVMNQHTVEGARIILETEDQLELAATVAYEHHIKLDGGGYPILTHPRTCHPASDLVHVCDVFDALRTDRPYREAWPSERVLGYVEDGAGREFDPDLARAFVQMMNMWEQRVHYVEDPKAPLPLGDAGGSSEAGGELDVTELPELDLEEDDMSWE